MQGLINQLRRNLRQFYLASMFVLAVSACSMPEEMRRIEETREAEQRRESSRSTNLTGEQIFVRSCNTCHPQGKAGLGPSLEGLSDRYPDPEVLKALIRKGKGAMPAQLPSMINDEELDNLLDYIKAI